MGGVSFIYQVKRSIKMENESGLQTEQEWLEYEQQWLIDNEELLMACNYY
jgi:hypothetical protein